MIFDNHPVILALALAFFVFDIVDKNKKRNRQKDRGIRPKERPQQHRQGKIFDTRPTKPKYSRQNKHQRQSCIERSYNCLLKTSKYHIIKISTTIAFQIFSNSIKHYNRVINR